MPHDGHDHSKTFVPDEEESLNDFAIEEMAIRELLIEKGVFTADEFRRSLEILDSRSPEAGAAVVARAWTDPDFRELLLRDGNTAVAEYGVEMGDTVLYTVENTPDVHNVVVCTLCSCYPKPLLGIPPDWYKSRNYRTRTVREPREVLKEFGTEIPANKEVRVHDSTADLRYLVLPERPEGTEDMSAEDLAALVTRDAMIGVTLVQKS
ncbi:nitrile hydratase subunit alpha [Alphaproteobacteria bacterium HT1-32]|nr:nitrile hydratase subunit alpha [Alphaproteobacteria bacterium HT1-32]